MTVIGLDGATMTLIKPWAERGILPNLARIMNEGTSGVLRSTVPPYTPTAWSSFYTGVNPGKHGIYGFTRANEKTGKRELVNSRLIGSNTIWHMLNQHGLKTGLFNLPLTYPPENVDGYMVSGMMTPKKADCFTYPESLGGELQGLDQPYVIDIPVVPVADHHDTDVVKRLRASLDGRREAILYLMKEHPCDFLMAVFVVHDRIQHVYWKYLDETSLLYDTPTGREFRKEIMGCYIEQDRIIGEMLKLLDSESMVFVMSDHGFCKLRSEFSLNNWLEGENYLDMGNYGRGFVRFAYRTLRLRKLVELLTSTSAGRVMRERGLNRAINWKRTLAYAHEQGLYLNVRGRDNDGVIEPGEEYDDVRCEIARRLKTLTDPETGKKLVDSVLFKEDVYTGPYLDEAPDIIPVFGNYSCYIHDGAFGDDILVDRTASPFGAHHPDGIFMAMGPGINSNSTIRGARILDVTPTMLYALGLPVPAHMDGKVLLDVFSEKFRGSNELKREAGSTEKAERGAEVYSSDEEDEIASQLRGMGYL